MHTPTHWIALAALAQLARAEFGLAGQMFRLQGGFRVNNAKLTWEPVNGASSYRVELQQGSSEWYTGPTVSGNTADSYDLGDATYQFRVTALNGGTVVDTSSILSLETYDDQLDSLLTYDNTKPSGLRLKSRLEANGVYYRYNYERDAQNSFGRFIEQTSSNGYDFSGDKTVLTGSTLCASTEHSCKLERVTFHKNPTTGQFVLIAHYERADGYGLGWLAIAHIDPGADSMIVDSVGKVAGTQDSRDMAFFADGNNAYLVISTNVNTDNYIYSLSSTWTQVDSLLTVVNKGAHREAPAVIRRDGWYYLCTSTASGWLPSQPQCIAAQNMAGPWGESFIPSSVVTFGAQSGGIEEVGKESYAMLADRWSNQWPTNGGPTRQLMLPVSTSAGGFLAYDFYKTVYYSDDAFSRGRAVFGEQAGRILSVDKPSSSDAGSTNIAFANDGTHNDPDNVFVPNKVPFWFQIDLQDAHRISQVDLTTKIVPGSETLYRYTVSVSNDGKQFSVVADKRDGLDVGFSVSYPNTADKFRFVRINVEAVENNINGHEANWAVGVHEVTVYG